LRSVLEFFWQFLLGVTGAVGFAALIVGATTLACGFGLVSCGYGWRRWRRRRRRRRAQPPEDQG
jgi:uncharacterized protein (DUF2062 family)